MQTIQHVNGNVLVTVRVPLSTNDRDPLAKAGRYLRLRLDGYIFVQSLPMDQWRLDILGLIGRPCGAPALRSRSDPRQPSFPPLRHPSSPPDRPRPSVPDQFLISNQHLPFKSPRIRAETGPRKRGQEGNGPSEIDFLDLDRSQQDANEIQEESLKSLWNRNVTRSRIWIHGCWGAEGGREGGREENEGKTLSFRFVRRSRDEGKKTKKAVFLYGRNSSFQSCCCQLMFVARGPRPALLVPVKSMDGRDLNIGILLCESNPMRRGPTDVCDMTTRIVRSTFDLDDSL
ncbi:hypothetical protein B296_00034749 [Ensete ventricosum]|uniref:Uncharacterized protein n=1 Tax=Ensete ventricosum TaxID=4639 RepID=A0A426ZGW8_ENSVE|nr:hypothetical protein B296_00034749 [Ensete ventricosum]